MIKDCYGKTLNLSEIQTCDLCHLQKKKENRKRILLQSTYQVVLTHSIIRFRYKNRDIKLYY